MWPEPTLLRDKLYGNLEELRRTAAFLRVTGISLYDDDEEEVLTLKAHHTFGQAAAELGAGITRCLQRHGTVSV